MDGKDDKMSLPEQKSLTNEQLRQFCEYNFDFDELAAELRFFGGSYNIATATRHIILKHLDPTVIIDWIRDNLEPSDIWDMDEYDGEVIREYVSIGNERAYDERNDR